MFSKLYFKRLNSYVKCYVKFFCNDPEYPELQLIPKFFRLTTVLRG
jgi:hypothetical protein